MDEITYDASAAAKQLSLRLLKQDFVNDLLGLRTGRPRRFFNLSARNSPIDVDNEMDGEITRAILQQIIQADVARRIERLNESIALAETASYEALIEARELLQGAFKHLRNIQKNAHVLPDGRRVYLSEDGSYAIDEELNQLDEDEMAGVEWKPGMSTAEDYIEAREAVEKAEAEVREIEAYREKLAEAQNRIENGDIDTADELDALENDIAAMPAAVRQKYEALGGAPENNVKSETSNDMPASRSDPILNKTP